MMHDLTDEQWAFIQLASSKRQVEKQPTNLSAAPYPWPTRTDDRKTLKGIL